VGFTTARADGGGDNWQFLKPVQIISSQFSTVITPVLNIAAQMPFLSQDKWCLSTEGIVNNTCC